MAKKTSEASAEQVEKIWAALAEYGIYSEQDLKKAMKEMKPLDIGCLVSPRNESEAVI